MVPRWLVGPLVAFALGFALGGSVFWGVFGPNVTLEQANAAYEQRSTNHDPGKSPTDDPWTKWVAAFTAALVIATIGLGIATVGLYRTGERQLRLIRRNAKQQDNNLRILQRAYISVQPGGITARSNNPARCHANIEIENAGNLPARHVKWTVTWATDADRRRSNLPVDEKSAGGDNTLPPGAKMIQGAADMVHVGNGPNQIEQRAGLFLYVWGAVFYEDGFGVNRETKFCHRYNCVNLQQKVDNKIVVGHFIDKQFARFNRFGNGGT